MGEETEAYTAEIECVADTASDLEKELTACPYGERIMDLLERAEFIPEKPKGTEAELKAEAEQEDAELKKREEELREEGRQEVREKYINYLRGKRKIKAAEVLEELAEKEEQDSEQNRDEEEEPQNDKDDRGLFHPMSPI